ncbi:MAG: class I SAM-dependent methyltransferase [Candidatus Omnitrophota bacterium]
MRNKVASIIFTIFLSTTIMRLSVCAQDKTSPVRFAVVGCMHLAMLGPGEYSLIAQRIKERDPDFVLVLSDTVDAPGEEIIPVGWQEFYRLMNKTGIPLKHGSSSFEYKGNLFIFPGHGLFKRSLESELHSLRRSCAKNRSYDNAFAFTQQSPWFDDSLDWSGPVASLRENKIAGIFGPNLQYLTLGYKNGVCVVSRSLPCYFHRRSGSPCMHFLLVDTYKHGSSIEFVTIKNTDDKHRDRQEALIKSHVLTTSERWSLLSPPPILKALHIKPGMDILDIGAGTGVFAFPFAEALKGKGSVFATEIDPEMIAHMQNKIKDAGLSNISPVLVTPNGLDHFYKEHAFDIIFLCETYLCIEDPESYFRQLRPSLKDAGRLYIINPVNTSDIGELEFGDFKQVARVLSSRGDDFPVFSRLSQKTRDFIRGWKGEDIPSDMRIRITQEFNGMLSDRWLFNDLMEYYGAKEDIAVRLGGHQEAARFGAFPYNLKWDKWLLVFLDISGVADKNRKAITDIDKRQLRIFNSTILTKAFGITRTIDRAYLKDKTMSTLKAAGYELVKSHDFLKEYYFLEFRKKP